ncbi:hypothetical protein [Robinsoniella peoriensis]|uniref:hypothetical protein n=1 Tax=Robinsoniella peoriensis TaxID=180332 RepID=UPI00085BDF51|nr:hypothetical protein [Robinsoniella peoriensis]
MELKIKYENASLKQIVFHANNVIRREEYVNGTIVERDTLGNEIYTQIKKYNKNNILIYRKMSKEDSFWEESWFDDNGNETHGKDSDGFEFWKEYDQDGKPLHYKTNDDCEMWWEYNENGKLKNLKVI